MSKKKREDWWRASSMIRMIASFLAGAAAGQNCPFVNDDERIRACLRMLKKNVDVYVNQEDTKKNDKHHASQSQGSN